MLQPDEMSAGRAADFAAKQHTSGFAVSGRIAVVVLMIPQRREKDLHFAPMQSKKQIPPAKTDIGMTSGAFFRRVFRPDQCTVREPCERALRRFSGARIAKAAISDTEATPKTKKGTRYASPRQERRPMAASTPPWPA
jgi:hypothetical protein